MVQIISAATRFADAGKAGKRVRFLAQGYDLLDRARVEASAGKYEEALEFVYQAALRTAGAWVASSRVAKRKRLPSSAWERLALVGEDAQEWADKLKAYSRTRSRVISGLDDSVEPEVVLELMALVGEFLAVVDGNDALPFAA